MCVLFLSRLLISTKTILKTFQLSLVAPYAVTPLWIVHETSNVAFYSLLRSIDTACSNNAATCTLVQRQSVWLLSPLLLVSHECAWLRGDSSWTDTKVSIRTDIVPQLSIISRPSPQICLVQSWSFETVGLRLV